MELGTPEVHATGRLPPRTTDINYEVARALFSRGINSGTVYLWYNDRSSTPVLNKIISKIPAINPTAIAAWLVVFQDHPGTTQSLEPQINQGQTQYLLNSSSLKVAELIEDSIEKLIQE